jgi:hypothetical protein
MNNQHFPPGIRPVALTAVSEVERARACPHRHASAVQLERARTVDRASKAREGEVRFAFPLTSDGEVEAQSLTDAGDMDASAGAAGLAGDGTGSASVETGTGDSTDAGGSVADTQVQGGTPGGKSAPRARSKQGRK